MHHDDASEKFTPWYKSFYAWMIWGLLGLSVIANSVMTLYFFQHKPAEVNHQWYQEGIMSHYQKTDVQQAKAQGISALMHVDNLSKQVTITLQGKGISDYKALTLLLEHPSDQTQDQYVYLFAKDKNSYRGKFHHMIDGKRYLLIQPSNHQWQLALTGMFSTSKSIDLKA